jgi:hypothetical protein
MYFYVYYYELDLHAEVSADTTVNSNVLHLLTLYRELVQ